MKIALKEVRFIDLVWCIARTKFTLFSIEREVIGKSCRVQQHIRKLSQGKHDGLRVYDVEADKAKRALTPCFQNSKVRSRSPSLSWQRRLSNYEI